VSQRLKARIADTLVSDMLAAARDAWKSGDKIGALQILDLVLKAAATYAEVAQ
jgi:hypothetical protein